MTFVVYLSTDKINDFGWKSENGYGFYRSEYGLKKPGLKKRTGKLHILVSNRVEVLENRAAHPPTNQRARQGYTTRPYPDLRRF